AAASDWLSWVCLLEPWRTEMTPSCKLAPGTAALDYDADRSFGVEFEEVGFRRSAAGLEEAHAASGRAERLGACGDDRAVEGALIGGRQADFADDFDL